VKKGTQLFVYPPPIQPVKLTLRLEWITLPIVNGPPLVASAGV